MIIMIKANEIDRSNISSGNSVMMGWVYISVVPVVAAVLDYIFI
jgi:hypothetical protein